MPANASGSGHGGGRSVLSQSIDEVIAQLDDVVAWAIQNESPYGIFPALYVVVTEKVREAIARGGVFTDGPRMARLDVAFANRYLEALQQHRGGSTPTRSWQQSFAACDRFSSHLILQELLLGINAHINLDLGIAAALTAPGGAIHDLERDFQAINAVLGELVDDVKARLEQLSPRLGWILSQVEGEDTVLQFSIKVARSEAWVFAKQLALAPQDQWARRIAERDSFTARLAELVRSPGWFANATIWWVKRGECEDVPLILQALRGVGRPGGGA